jgi:hypothetical protein
MRRTQILWIAAAGLAILALIVGGVYATVRYRYQLRWYYDQIRTVLASGKASANDDLTNILFIHHSTGRALIEEGNVREILTEAGYQFWDVDYNAIGLTRPDGALAGYGYNLPRDNTDPDGLAELFAQPVLERPTNAFSAVLQHRVIAFKSCFPTSDIASEEQLETYKSYYLSMREVIDQHPDHLFIAMTPPPLVPESTTPSNAARARAWADWLTSEEYLAGHPNLVTFDFFDLLANGDPASPDYNMLREEYRLPYEGDSHPNKAANETVGPQFASFIIQAIEARR